MMHHTPNPFDQVFYPVGGVWRVVGLRRSFSNQSVALKTLIHKVLRGKQGITSRPPRASPTYSRGPVKDQTPKTQTHLNTPFAQEALSQYVAGKPVKEIAAEFGIHRRTVLAMARRAGLPRRFEQLSIETGEEARRLYEQGLSLEEVAEELGISRMGARSAILKSGGTMRPRGRQRRRTCDPQSVQVFGIDHA